MSEKSVRIATVSAVVGEIIGLPRQYDNTPILDANGNQYTPNAEPWVRINVLDMVDEYATLAQGGLNRISGEMQITVFAPKLNAAGLVVGDIPTYDTIEGIKQSIKTGAALEYNGQRVRIVSASHRPGTDEQNWWSRIIDVNFIAYIKREE